MYDKAAKMMAALAVIFLLTFGFVREAGTGGGEAYHTKDEIVYNYVTEQYKMTQTTSEARVIRERTMVRKRLAPVSVSDYEILCRIVQAEAGGEDLLGKQMVADVIINRVQSKKFPNSVQGVVFQGSGGKVQFSPVSDGRYYSVTISAETRKAVKLALDGEDTTGGALYFINAGKAASDNVSWFENSLCFCTEHGGHRFYK